MAAGCGGQHAATAPVTVVEIEAMRESVTQRGLAGFLRAATAGSWQAPAIPSRWSMEQVLPVDERPRADAARHFGAAFLDAIDALVPAMQTGQGTALQTGVETLLDAAYWMGGTNGYGNQLLAGRARDVAVVGLARLMIDESVPVATVRTLYDRTDAPFDAASVRAAVLNAEAGASIFPTGRTVSDADLQRIWRIGMARNVLDRRRHEPTRRGTPGPASEWFAGVLADIRQGLRTAGVDPDEPNPHAAFFIDDIQRCTAPATTKRCWDAKWHHALLLQRWTGNRNRLGLVLQFRETVGSFPTAPPKREDTSIPEQHDAFAQAWEPYLGNATYNLGYRAWPFYESIRQGTFVDDDTQATRLWEAKDARARTPAASVGGEGGTPAPEPAAGQEVLLRDFSTLKNLGPRRVQPFITGATGRVHDPKDTKVGTAYADDDGQIYVDVVVQRFGDSTWLMHELEKQFRARTGAEFSDEVTIVETGARRRFEINSPGTAALQMGLAPNSRRTVAWLAADNTVVALSFVAMGAGRTNELPAELLDGYLDVYPSTLPGSVADTQVHHESWIRDEMRRLLAYAERDLRVARISKQQTSPDEWQRDAQRLLGEFAGLRERFFGTGSAASFAAEVRAAELRNVDLLTQDLDVAKQIAWLEQRVGEFQTWWQTHQDDPIDWPVASGTPTP